MARALSESELDTAGLADGKLRQSKRSTKMTEKGAEFHAQILESQIQGHQATYAQFKTIVRDIRVQLKDECSEEDLGKMRDKLINNVKKASNLFSEIRRKSSPTHDVIRKQDVLEAVSKDVLKLLNIRTFESDEVDFDKDAEAIRLRLLLNHDYARSIYGSTASKCKSLCSEQSQVSQNRIDIAAEDEKLEAEIESQRTRLKMLELEKEVRVLKAKLQAHDTASQCHQSLPSVPSETHSAYKRVSPQRSVAQHRSSPSPSTIPSLTQVESSVFPLRPSAPAFIPVLPVHPAAQQSDHSTSHCNSFGTVQQPSGNNSALAQQQPSSQPLQQSLPTPAQVPDVSSTTVLAQALHDTMTLNRLPVPTPSIFTGDPLQFLEWQVAFTALIDQRGMPASQKLHYLKQYLGGEAKEVVEGTFFGTDDDSYIRAWEKLRKRFGQPFVVQRAFRQKIALWPKIGPRDYVGFRRFSDFLNSCRDAMPYVPGLCILNDCEENQKILHKLPEWITSRWNRAVTAELEKTGCYPSFETFTTFLSKEAEIACNPISSQLALRTQEIERSSREKKSNVRTLSTSSTKSSEVKANSYPSSFASTAHQATPSTTTTTSKPAYCHFCKKDHSIHHCNLFLKEKLEKRKAFVVKNHLCFGCLKKGHSSKECRHRSTCATCQKRHPTSLHGDIPSVSDTVSGKKPVKDNHQMITPQGNKEVPSSVSCRTNIGDGGSTSMIVPVWVSAADQPNREVLVYALLDTQSDTSFILEDTVAALSVQRTPVQLKLSTMTATDSILRCDAVKGLQVRGFSSHT